MHGAAQTFGYWLRRRRKALDLTQQALANRVSCSAFAIRKIEADERRPSRRLADRLAVALAVPEAERADFVDAARRVYADSRLGLDRLPVSADEERTESLKSSGSPPVHDSFPFVGRGNEFAELVSRLPEPGAGAGTTVLIEGEPGIGKSRLMQELKVRSFVGRCYEIERTTAYQPVIDLIARVLDFASDTNLRGVPEVSLAELAALVPEIGERVPGLPQLSSAFPEARQMRLARAVGQLLDAAIGEASGLVMVNDIQWADEASAQVLHYLGRHVSQRSILLIYAYRGEDADTDDHLARLVQSLHRDTGAQLLRLSRLTYVDTRDLLGTFYGTGSAVDGLAVRLQSETDGNPFFLTSILQSLGDDASSLPAHLAESGGFLPDSLRAAVRVRLAHVPRETWPILEMAAVMGRRFDFDTLLEVTGSPEEELLESVESLVIRRLLRENSDDGMFDFSHDKVREVVYRDIGGARRRLLHQSVAEALERRSEDETSGRAGRLAEHYERAHDWAKALKYLVLAGEHSLTLFAMKDAVRWLDRAVALIESHPSAGLFEERLAVYERRGLARTQAGQTAGAVEDFRRVIEACRASGDAQKTCDALIQLGMAYRRADCYDEATACLTEALAECRAVDDYRRAADTLYHLGTVAWSTALNDRAIRFHQEAVNLCVAVSIEDIVAVQAYHGRGEAYYANAQPIPAIANFNKSLLLARELGDKGYEAENLMMIGHACVGTRGLGDYARATQHLEAGLAIARSADLQWHMGPILLGLDHVRACTGFYGVAWAGMKATLSWLESLKQERYQLIAYDFIGHLLLDIGQNELAIDYLERGLALGRESNIAFWRPGLLALAATARSRLGGRDGAPELTNALEQTRHSAEGCMGVRCLEALAEISLSAGDSAACRTYADELLGIAVANGLAELEAIARRWRGEAFLAEGQFEKSLEDLAFAARCAHAIGRRRLEIDAAVALARLHSAQGRRSEARRRSDEAHTYSQMLAKSLADSGLQTRLGS